eukprot:16448277-Heterocapsa_arctica.AAC.1
MLLAGPIEVAPPMNGETFPLLPAPGEPVGTRPGPRPAQQQEVPQQVRAGPRAQAKANANPGCAANSQGPRAGVPGDG